MQYERKKLFLISDSVAHFLVDCLCVFVVLGMKGDRSSDGMLIYNTLAFSTQCLVGLWVDGLDELRTFRVKLASVLVVAFAAFAGPGLGIPYIPACVIAGVGNSFFHVAAGTMVMREDSRKASKLGVFVAPGAIGITLGKLAVSGGYKPFAGIVLLVILIAAFAAEKICIGKSGASRKSGNAVPWTATAAVCQPADADSKTMTAVVLLTAAVAVRAIGGSAVSFTWSSLPSHALLLTVFVWLGKTGGGFVCDRIGAKKTALVSVPAAAICVAFFYGNMALSLVGQLAVNLTMPVTLWLLYRLMPDSPALAFGLAASALWPGTIIGMLFTFTGVWQWVCIVVSFGFSLFAILYSCRKLKF